MEVGSYFWQGLPLILFFGGVGVFSEANLQIKRGSHSRKWGFCVGQLLRGVSRTSKNVKKNRRGRSFFQETDIKIFVLPLLLKLFKRKGENIILYVKGRRLLLIIFFLTRFSFRLFTSKSPMLFINSTSRKRKTRPRRKNL